MVLVKRDVMSSHTLRFLVISCLLGGVGFVQAEPPADKTASKLRMGFAEVDITPPLGFPMAGYYHVRLAKGSLDPLIARAIVFQEGDTRAALVICDLIGIARDLSVQVRKRASAKTGIPEANIVLTATHTHTAPDYMKDLYDYIETKRTPATAEKSPYAEKLISGIASAIEKALSAAQPVSLTAGSAIQQLPVSFNRRFVMRDGTVKTWQRLDGPDVVRAAGPIDPEIPLLVARSASDRKLLGMLSNFALHLDTVGGQQWSADYPRHVADALRNDFGSEFISAFGTGTCGDINHVDPVRKDRNKSDFIGQSLAKTIREGIGDLPPVKETRLQARSRKLDLALQDVTVDQIAKARGHLLEAKAGKTVDFFDLVRAQKAIMLDHYRNAKPHANAPDFITWGLSHSYRGIGPRLPVEVHTITLGDEVAIVCLPGEIFVDLGLAIKKASPFRTTFVIELANCVETIYIPTRAAYAGGSYEVINSTTEPGSGEAIVQAALDLLRESAGTLRPAKK